MFDEFCSKNSSWTLHFYFQTFKSQVRTFIWQRLVIIGQGSHPKPHTFLWRHVIVLIVYYFDNPPRVYSAEMLRYQATSISRNSPTHRNVFLILTQLCSLTYHTWKCPGAVVVVIVWQGDLILNTQSVVITTNVGSSNPAQASSTRYKITW
jgi:hypothetical protein